MENHMQTEREFVTIQDLVNNFGLDTVILIDGRNAPRGIESVEMGTLFNESGTISAIIITPEEN